MIAFFYSNSLCGNATFLRVEESSAIHFRNFDVRRVGFGNNLRSGLWRSSCELGAGGARAVLVPSAAAAVRDQLPALGRAQAAAGAAAGCACAGDLGSPGDPARPPAALCSRARGKTSLVGGRGGS